MEYVFRVLSGADFVNGRRDEAPQRMCAILLRLSKLSGREGRNFMMSIPLGMDFFNFADWTLPPVGPSLSGRVPSGDGETKGR